MTPTEPVVGGDWPLVGRAGEFRLLADLLVRPEARGLVLAGPAGVGKTRLGTEWLQEAERSGLATVRTTAIRGASGVPFAAVAPLLGPAAPGAAPSGADQFRRFVSALADRAGTSRLAVLIDDAHLLDELSAMLIYQLAASETSIVTLLTVRSREQAPESVTSLWKDSVLERLELGGLDGEAVDQLLVAALGAPVDRATVARLAARCQGNVFFLRELVLGALRAGTLVSQGGMWRLVGPLTPSPRLVEIVEARLAGLNSTELGLVEGLALAEPLGPAEVAAVADFEGAERLERDGLIRSGLAGRRLEFRLAHPLHGEVLRARQSALRARRLTGQLVEAVETTGAQREDDGLRLATWRLDAGQAQPGALVAASATAHRRNNLPLAERLARAAVDAGAGFPAAVTAAQLAFLQGRGGEAERELADLAGRATDDNERGLVAIIRVENLRLLGRFTESAAVAEEAAGVLTDEGCRLELDAMRAWLLLDMQGPAVAAVAAEEASARGSGRALAWGCLVSALALARMGRVDAALHAAERGQAAHVAMGGPGQEWLGSAHALARADALAAAGRLDEAAVGLSSLYSQAVADGNLDSQAWAVWQLSRVLLAQGRLASAVRCAREACALFRHLHRPALLRDALAPLAAAEAMAGRAEDAAATLAEADGLGLPTGYWAEAERLQAHAWAAVAAGDAPTARAILDQAVEVAEPRGDRVGAGRALHDLARLGQAKRVVDHAAALVATMEGDLPAALLVHIEALASGDGAALNRASTTFESIGSLLLAAEAAADAAVAFRRDGEERAAVAASRRATTLAEGCEGAATPALAAIESRALLTAAEWECARLAVGGRSNRDIAEALFLSVRTVENRLQRIYEKLGVSGRADLALALEVPSD